jgi:Uma2 family endonuclease
MPPPPKPAAEIIKEPWSHDGKPHPGRRMTEEEFVEWVEEKTRAEWVDGAVVMMSPVSDDQDVFTFWIRAVMQAYVKRHDLGRVRGPLLMIRLGPERSRREPDVLFVSTERLGVMRRNHIEGAPDLIVEVVGPESRQRDWVDKFAEYALGGVREYWVLDRDENRVEAYSLTKAGKYRRVREKDGKIASTVLPGFYLRPEWLLGDEPPDEDQVLRELGVR